MAKSKRIVNRFIKVALAIALLLDSNSQIQASNSFNTVSQGVVRVDLTRQIQPYHEITQVDLDDNEIIQLEDEIIDENNYSQLRAHQRKAIFISQNKQSQVTNLAQQTSGADEKSTPESETNIQTKTEERTDVNSKSKVTQLVSEIADASEDNKDELQLQVPLESKNDAVYMGTVFIGSPESQPANVVFDTGSEYLAVTSNLCDDRTAGNFKFKKYDPTSGSFVERDQKTKRCKTMAFDIHKSDSQKILSKASSKLTYGSAKLQGFIWQDYTCIQPLKSTPQTLAQDIKTNKCALFQFLALYKSQGLGKKSDGILGLSPHKDMNKKKFHYLYSLKENGIIDHAMVSFSITSKDMNETPYALFGGYNSTQIVGGGNGLKTFKNFPNWLGTWALEGQGMYYGATPMQKPGEDTAYPAIIDTGSSQLSIPPDVFEKIRTEWNKALPELDCTSDKTFCHVGQSCDAVSKKVKPVGFQMSDYVFEINPDQYLYKANDEKCYFVIHKCRLPGKNKNLFLIGDAFLRHFYSVYDFDQDQISLGINTHSQGQVNMYKPGERPADLVQSVTSQDKVEVTEVDDDKVPTAPSSISTTQTSSQLTSEKAAEKAPSSPLADIAIGVDVNNVADVPTDIDDIGLKSKIVKK